LKLIIQGV